MYALLPGNNRIKVIGLDDWQVTFNHANPG
jgi:hypothetical protein